MRWYHSQQERPQLRSEADLSAIHTGGDRSALHLTGEKKNHFEHKHDFDLGAPTAFWLCERGPSLGPYACAQCVNIYCELWW